MAVYVFGRAVDRAGDWDNRTTYTLGLDRAAAGSPAAVPLRIGQVGGGGEVHPNLVVTREPIQGRTLAEYADAARKDLCTRLPGAKVVRSGDTVFGAIPGRELEVAVRLDHPLPAVTQWHAFLVQDDHCYHFCGTSTQAQFAEDSGRFRALLEEWAAPSGR